MLWDRIPILRLNESYNYVSCYDSIDGVLSLLSDERNLVMELEMSVLVKAFLYLTVKDLKTLRLRHFIVHDSSKKRIELRKDLIDHGCMPRCPKLVYVFRERTRKRLYVENRSLVIDTEPTVIRSKTYSGGERREFNSHAVDDLDDDFLPDSFLVEYKYLEPPSDELKRDIIEDWESEFSTDNLLMASCAVCARKMRRRDLSIVKFSAIDWKLLRNDRLPEYVLPKDYTLSAYGGAILHADGLIDRFSSNDIRACSDCSQSLNRNELPRFALANHLYYGISALPPDIKEAFESASLFELMLISRARASNICFRFKGVHGDDEGTDVSKLSIIDRSRKGLKGNVMVSPSASIRLLDVLPPSYNEIADTFCTVFVGKTTPSRATLAKLGPVLVRKSRVEKLIRFLINNNPHYRAVDGFNGFSQSNLNALFGDEDRTSDEAVPCSIDIGHVETRQAVEGVSSDVSLRDEYMPGEGGIVMENVGYTTGDDSPQSYRDMKMQALTHCLEGGGFVMSRSGSKPIPDFDNPYLLSWLFPHLDPWGIGGFHHPERRRRISSELQLRYLLSVSDGRFQRDTEFVFVYFNISQKKNISNNIRFKVPQMRYNQIIKDLLAVDVNRLTALRSSCRREPNYRPTDPYEVNILRLLSRITMVGSNIVGSAAYKVAMRNEIRAMINYKGTPTFFITLNPSDIDNPLVRFFAGDNIRLEDIARGEDMNKWSRALFAARNPASCAIFFHIVITKFVKIILRYGAGVGLLGRCSGFYGTVEAQGRGTLHCHMLVWLDGHPSPQGLRDRMLESEEYKLKTFRWLEAIIKCELLGTETVVEEKYGPLPRPNRQRESGDPNPGVLPAPSVLALRSDRFAEEYREFVNALVKEYNWHVHMSTCWKHLGRKQVRSDENCRMGINGVTIPETVLDEETHSILLRRLHPRIAPFNDVIIFLMKGNMDIKFIGSGEAAKAYLYYITDYITKASLPVYAGLAALSYAIQQTNAKVMVSEGPMLIDNEKKAMTITVNSMMGHSEISHQQVMSYLVGGGDHYTSEKFQILHWGAFRKFVIGRWALSNSGGGGGENESESGMIGDDDIGISITLYMGAGNIVASNQQFDYIFRPHNVSFDGLCLFEFVERVKKKRLSLVRMSSPGRFSNPLHPQYGSHVLTLRNTRDIPVLLGDAIPSSVPGGEEYENWARDMLILFKPWRDPMDLRERNESWGEAYQAYKNIIKPRHEAVIRNFGVLKECKDARGSHVASLRALRPVDISEEVDEDFLDVFGDAYGDPGCVNVFDCFPSSGKQDDAVDDIEGHVDISTEIGAINDELLDMCLPADANDIRTVIGTVSEVTPDDREVIKEQTEMMSVLRKRRRPTFEVVDGQTPTRRTWNRVTGPSVGISRVDTNYPTSLVSRMRAMPDQWNVVLDIVREMGLEANPEQLRAMMIISNHILHGNDQLLMYIAGIGGTGKTHVIRSLVLLFERLGRRSDLLLGAPTGIAAVLIGGYTLHSISMSTPHGKSKDVTQLISLWRGVKYLIIDEVSMVGALFLSQFSARLKQGKGEDPVAASKPFGGVNVIFTGDFAQLKPPQQHPLFSHRLVHDPSFEEVRDEDGIGAMNGVVLWRQVQVVVKLIKNQRHGTDPVFASVLDRLRVGESSSQATIIDIDGHSLVRDLDYLRNRELSKLVGHSPESLPTFRDAPVIVGSRDIRDAINVKLIAYHAKRLGQAVNVYHSRDFHQRQPVAGTVRERFWGMSSRETRDSLGRLPLFLGMKVMVMDNLAFGNGVVNGSEGTVHDIKYEVDEDGRRYASVVYVRIPGSALNSRGLDPDVVPIVPERTRFDFVYKTMEKSGRRSVSRQQIPILPAYSYTDFKSQGRTLEKAIVDLATARGQGVYVMLSRVKTLSGIAILRWFPSSRIYHRLSQEVRNELIRIDYLDRVTKAAYDRGLL